LASTEVQPKLISWYGNTFGQSYFVSEGKQTTNLASVSLSRLRAFPVRLPPLAEQQRIVDEVERRLSLVDDLETVVEHGLRRAGRLRQAVLKRAFEGKLVPQDPNDEPASALLERIRAERAAAESNGRQPGRAAGRRRQSKAGGAS
jgi:type I restriction enzyme S subunit